MGISIILITKKVVYERYQQHYKKIYSKTKISYDEYIVLIEFGYEMQFFYGKRKFGSTQFDGFEFYEWNKEEGYQSYQTIEEFEQKVNIDGKLLKNVWQDVHQFELGC